MSLLEADTESESASWPPTRAEGERRLREFLPRAGRSYAERRNLVTEAGEPAFVSTLSPYIRHRLVTEREVLAAVLGRFSLRQAEKFAQEVCWRTYWKGWLELRPGVWRGYRDRVASLCREVESGRSLRDRFEAATGGRSGIECLDGWADELITTGYLHNHARMWFASIWIFTLRLPWELGADFFYRHLLDGDPASNTLSWRWVAGLQTPGKAYLARPDNIATYTSGRTRPTEPLAEVAEVGEVPPLPSPRALPRADRPAPGPVGLLLTEDDLDPSSLDLGPLEVRAVAGFDCPADRSPMPVGPLPASFSAGAMADALRRSREAFGVPADRIEPDEVLDWARRLGLGRVVSPESPQGPARDRIDRIRGELDRVGVTLQEIRRPWDDAFWPLATRGFFPFRSRIPEVLARLGLGAGDDR
jgi:deoxyribodipyrimidine photo-lyase